MTKHSCRREAEGQTGAVVISPRSLALFLHNSYLLNTRFLQNISKPNASDYSAGCIANPAVSKLLLTQKIMRRTNALMRTT